MENQIVNDNALMEVYTILTKLKLYQKLPIEFQNFIELNKNKEHSFDFNREVPLFEQVHDPITRNLLSYIFLKYINESSENKKFFEHEIKDIMNANNSE